MKSTIKILILAAAIGLLGHGVSLAARARVTTAPVLDDREDSWNRGRREDRRDRGEEREEAPSRFHRSDLTYKDQGRNKKDWAHRFPFTADKGTKLMHRSEGCQEYLDRPAGNFLGYPSLEGFPEDQHYRYCGACFPEKMPFVNGWNDRPNR